MFLQIASRATRLYCNAFSALRTLCVELQAKQEVVSAAGFSGHGFKFASVIGEILADLTLNRSTGASIDFLNLKRFRRRPDPK